MDSISLSRFKELLPSICAQDTSADPDGWTDQNPLWGHCAVVALVAQNLFGGKLLRASLENTPFAFMRSHYVNRLPDGKIVDFTKAQFEGAYPKVSFKARARANILAHESTKNRYKKLALRLAYAVTENPLLLDPIYAACFSEALDSGCQKMWVGAVLVRNEVIVSRGNNHPLQGLLHICKPTCIRFKIQSRTESMIGACGHAEEYAMWGAVEKGISLSECDMYVALLHTNGLPRFRNPPFEPTCIRCATAMNFAGIKSIYIDCVNVWKKISIPEALHSSLQFALGEKKV